MTYFECLIYDTAGNFLGHSIMGDRRLQSTHLYADDEVTDLNKRLQELNTAVDLRKHWPHPRDPEVLAILDSPEFHPLEMHTVEIVDLENSPRIVYKQIANPEGWSDNEPGPYPKPEWVDSDEVDEENSELAYKDVQVPVRPTDQVHRIKQACEIIARRRARVNA